MGIQNLPTLKTMDINRLKIRSSFLADQITTLLKRIKLVEESEDAVFMDIRSMKSILENYMWEKQEIDDFLKSKNLNQEAK